MEMTVKVVGLSGLLKTNYDARSRSCCRRRLDEGEENCCFRPVEEEEGEEKRYRSIGGRKSTLDDFIQQLQQHSYEAKHTRRIVITVLLRDWKF